MKIIERLKKILKNQRPYASHWEWPEKGVKESGIMRDYLRARQAIGLPAYASVEASVQDPPDFLAHGSNEEKVAVELTELVSAQAIKANVKASCPEEHVYRDWHPDEVKAAIEERLQNKDSKTYKGGPYDEIVIVLHTDEPRITAQEYIPILASHTFSAKLQITEVYVLFSYDPTAYGCPLVRLKLS